MVRIKAAPAEDNKDAAKFWGAYANAWVDAENLREAAQKAFSFIKEAGWPPVRFEHRELVCRDDYSVATDGEAEVRRIHQCIAIVMKPGVGLMLSNWPKHKRGRRGRRRS